MIVPWLRRSRPGRRLQVLGILSACFLLGFAQQSHAQWTRVEAPQLINTFIADLDYVTPWVAYALVASPGNVSAIYKTNDGGFFWEKLDGVNFRPYTLKFLDAHTGMIGGHDTVCGCMVISRTTDGGNTWKLDSIRSADGTVERGTGIYGIYSFHFIDNTVGFATGAAGTVLKTTDRGATWTRLDIGSTTDVVASITGVEADSLYAVAGSSNNSFNPNTFYRTLDGGTQWQSLPNFIEQAAFSKIYFTTPSTGFVIGGEAQAVIYKTIDGGRNWARKYLAGYPGAGFYDIAFENENAGYAIGSVGMIARTTDGGETWTLQPAGTNASFQTISVIGETIYVAGMSGTILRRGPAPVSGVESSQATAASGALLPNPVITSATVSHPGLAREGGRLEIHDPLGREIRRVEADAGTETLQFSREGLTSGVYFYRLVAGTEVLSSGTMVVQ